ncbi:uncharacterized protein FIBRA_07663 [Fibroporia radiculosa]|uniref:Uncharacterized protein n=1 Tax=Fibroporia radiculosa TaxID=599839 RepID=J4H4R4_9APHY|nr:uncharacterized protein FIBRA_07663 [Fibroporia radiculosa]CCM05444.1 predicted protein [Fibroporia radiculosa]
MLEESANRGGADLRDLIEPVWTGTVAYRGLISVGRLVGANGEHRTIGTPMMYCGKGKAGLSHPCATGSVVNVVAFVSQLEKEGTPYGGPWVEDCSKQELLDCYAGWEPEVAELLEQIQEPTRWAIHHLRPLPMCVAGKVVLLGDAAHAMSPHQGAGAGQAIEVQATIERGSISTHR